MTQGVGCDATSAYIPPMSNSPSDPVVIASYARTPMGGFQVVFAPV